METDTFTDADKQRLNRLDRIAQEMVDKELVKLAPWSRLTSAVSLLAFACIFFLPHGKETNWLSYVFPFLSLGAFSLFLYLFHWKSKLTAQVEVEFLAMHGKEHKILVEKKRAADRIRYME